MKKIFNLLAQIYNGTRIGVSVGLILTAIIVNIAAGIDAIKFNNEHCLVWYSIITMILLIMAYGICVVVDGILKDVIYLIKERKQ